jgi:hypothetical protein
MGDKRPDRRQPDSRADDRKEPHPLALRDSMVFPHIMDDTMNAPVIPAGSAKLAARTARAECFAECLRHRNVWRRGALLHYLADILVDLADIDDVHAGFCSQITVIEHRRSRAVVVGGAEQVGAANLLNLP